MAAVGRPSKFTPQVLETASRYIEQYDEYEHAIPSIAGLSLVLDVHRDTIYGWAQDEDKAEFSYILSKLLNQQENVLLSKGLKGEFNSNITKLALGKHGYHDKQEHTGADGKDLIPESNPEETARNIAFLLAQGLQSKNNAEG